ncbi:hypothetical protein T439DRAFT_348955 [Meredithblackwellia eburnea MCA 4105]
MKVEKKDYHKYYLRAPNSAQRKEYRAVQKRAFEHRLMIGDSLAWNGPNLFPDTLSATSQTLTETINIPHQLRQPLPHLLAPTAPAFGGIGWSLRLVESVREGKDLPSQIWKCEVLRWEKEEEVSAGMVVVKLRQQSLYVEPGPHDSNPDFDDWNWWPAEYYYIQESHVYSALRRLQGRILPTCYGFYNFKLSTGEQCVGMVMEDLTSTTDVLFSVFQEEKKDGLLSPEFYTPFLFEIFRAQKAIHDEFELLCLVTNLKNVLVIRETTKDLRPHLVFLGFGPSKTVAWQTESRTNLMESQKGTVYYDPTELIWNWRISDQELLGRAFAFAVQGVEFDFSKWARKNQEKLTQELPFLEGDI